jgi:anti-sigma factor (TIGR02949 family)
MAATMSALDCRDLEPLLHAYVDGEFQDADRAEFEAHLAQCAGCRQRVSNEQLFREKLRAAATVRAPEALRARITEAVQREQRWSGVRRLVRSESVAVAAAAMAAGVLAFIYGRHLFQPLVHESVVRFQRDPPVEVRGDEQQVQRWFAGKVDFNVQLPHLRNVSVAGARISHLRDRDAAYVVYQGPRAHRVSLIVFDDPRVPLEMGLSGTVRRIDDRDVLMANERGYNVALWRDNEIVYSLVSDLDERDIVDLLSGRASTPTRGEIKAAAAPLPTPDVQPVGMQVQ